MNSASARSAQAVHVWRIGREWPRPIRPPPHSRNAGSRSFSASQHQEGSRRAVSRWRMSGQGILIVPLFLAWFLQQIVHTVFRYSASTCHAHQRTFHAFSQFPVAGMVPAFGVSDDCIEKLPQMGGWDNATIWMRRVEFLIVNLPL